MAKRNKCAQIAQTSGGWMDNEQIYVLFNSISVISGRWPGDNERLCAIEPSR